MDSFKVNEVERMSKGGNRPWKDFFDAHQSNKLQGRNFEDCTIQERYDSEAGEEWKDRLTAKVEGKAYVPGQRPKVQKKPDVRSSSPMSGSRSQTPSGRTTGSPGPTARNGNGGQKAQNEAYFARMGQENAHRPEGVAPNQGGKFTGFGSAPPPSHSDNPGEAPKLDDFQKDPIGALTKGFGWLGSTVSKQANAGYKGFVQPNMQKLSESDFAKQAQIAAGQVGSSVTAGAKNATTSFNRFVEGESSTNTRSAAGGAAPERQDFWDDFGGSRTEPAADKKDFWDDFAAAGETKAKAAPSSIGTSAMKKPGGGKGGEDWEKW